MSQHNQETWEILLRAGVVEGDAPETGKLDSPWYVKVLLAFSGWLAAIFLLIFFGLGYEFLHKNSIASLITGALLIGTAFVILRKQKNEFVENLGLAISLTGQALVVYAIILISDHNEQLVFLLITLLQTSLAILMPNSIHRIFSSFFAALSFSLALNFQGWAYIVTGIYMFLAAWCLLNEFTYPQHMRKMRSIGYGLVLALISLKGISIFGLGGLATLIGRRHSEIWAIPLITEILTAAVALYVVWHILKRYGRSNFDSISIAALSAALLICTVSIEVQGITVGVVIMSLGFFGSNRVLLGLGIVSLIFYISSYYYLLDTTLLSKSLSLLVIGIVLLALRWLMARVLPTEEEGHHA